MGCTVYNVLKQKFNLMPFTGAWRDFLGTPAPTGVWSVQGTSGSGKTSFSLQLAKYLRTAMHKRVIFWSLEQYGDYGLQVALRYANFNKNDKGIYFAGPDEEADVLRMMQEKRGYNVLIIDTLTALCETRPKGFTRRDFYAWKQLLADSLVIYILHEEEGTGQLTPNVAAFIRKQAAVKISVVGFEAFANNRAGNVGGGGGTYIVNQSKRDEYHLQNL